MIKPLPGYVLIEPIEDDEKTAKGVYLPETSKDKPSKGKVVAVSDVIATEKRFYSWADEEPAGFGYAELKPGDIIYHKKWVNETVNYEGEEYLFVRFEDLLGVE